MIHFALSHFPIALLITGAASLALSAVTPVAGERLRTAALVMLGAGAIAAVPTVAAGLWIAGEHQGHHGDTLSTHRLLGIATVLTAAAGVGLHLVATRVANADLVRNLVFFAAAALAGSTGYVGAEMAHGTADHGDEPAGHEHGTSAGADADDHHSDAGTQSAEQGDEAPAILGAEHHGTDSAGTPHDDSQASGGDDGAQPAPKAPHDHSTHKH